MAFILGALVGLIAFWGFRNVFAALGCAFTVTLGGLFVLAAVDQWQRSEADEELRGEERTRVPSELVGTWKGEFEYDILNGHGIHLRITVRKGKVGENVAKILISGKLIKGECRATGELESAYERRIVLRPVDGKCDSVYSSYRLTVEPPEESGGEPRVTFRDGTFKKVG